MSEFGGSWNHENNQHALVVPPKTERGKNGHIRYPLLWRNAERKNENITGGDNAHNFNVVPCVVTLVPPTFFKSGLATVGSFRYHFCESHVN